ncbi:MAG: hypothetical protein AAF267_12880 [Deinococcota bacterium]
MLDTWLDHIPTAINVTLRRQRVNILKGRYQGAKGTLVGYVDAPRSTACIVRLDDGRDIAIRAHDADFY